MVCFQIDWPVMRATLTLGLPGGVGDISIPSYSGVLFVVGGSGVTFALSAVQDLVLAGAKSRTRVIEVVWCVREPGLVFPPLLSVRLIH